MKSPRSLFSTRQHICYSALYAIARPSVRPSVCLSHGWISQRRLKLGSRNLHHAQCSPMTSFLTLNFTAKFQREERERRRQIREGYENFGDYIAASIVLRFTMGRHFRTIALLVCLPRIVFGFTRRRCRALTCALARLSCLLMNA